MQLFCCAKDKSYATMSILGRIEHTRLFKTYHALKARISPVWHGMRFALARSRRRKLVHVTYVGVTGSCGKTTTKELIGAILSKRDHGVTSRMTTNRLERVASTLLSLRRRDHFCVHELGGFEPGALARTAKLFRPDIGVITNVRYDHYSAFGSLDAIAQEKGSLIESLPEKGFAILNADDERVIAMQDRTGAQVITYGLSNSAMVKGEDVSPSWPNGVALTVRHDEQRVRVQTQLLGEHWAYAVLAAMATAVAMEIPLEEAADAISNVAPVEGRLNTQQFDGVTFIDDSWKSPLYSMPVCLKVMEEADAKRKIAVIGTMADHPGSSSRRHRKAAKQALAVADMVIFVGRWARSALKAGTEETKDRLMGFESVYQLRKYLRTFLEPGDVVLLKGCGADHLERILIDRQKKVKCWRDGCKRIMRCTDCKLRFTTFVPVDAMAGNLTPDSEADAVAEVEPGS